MLERIFHFAAATPDAIAIYDHDDALSYRAFADAIASARTGFADRQVGGDGIVALVAEAHSDYWIHAFALNSLGLTTVAVRRAEDLAELDLPELRFVVTSTPAPILETLRSERGVRLVPPPSLRDPPSWPTADERADNSHLLLSSGTTGRRKMLLCRFDVAEAAGMPTDATMIYHAFDYGPWTLAGFGIPCFVWNMGAAVLFHQLSGADVALRDLRATHAAIIPHTLNQILAAPEGTFPFNERLQLSIGGGPVSWAQVQQIKRRVTPHVSHSFGATEVARIAHTPLEHPEDQRWHRPVPGVRVEVVDDRGRPVAIGTVGELRVAYGSDRSSYHNDPATTATFFRHGFFYPGDLAVMREDGRFALEGRVTDVINLHGSKFNPMPLEAVIEETCGLGPCCIVSAPDAGGTEKLFVVVENPAYLEPANAERVARELTTFFADDWSGQIQQIDRLPRTESGKLLRREIQPMIARMASGYRIEPA